MSLRLISNATTTVDYVIYALLGGIIGGFIIDYTNLPSLITLMIGLILMGLDLGVGGYVAKILEGIGFAMTALGAYDIIKQKITIQAS